MGENNQEELEPMYQHLIQLVDDKNTIQKILTAKTSLQVYQILLNET
ncbi:hypothetical protein J416_08624 [Gracilibacillus halophilus YIM-C55.5]|uniref:Uncharacterized protein n=1 Tax=Gracilibacillus halophilus YIM-C55.5 TaxID=1308866 RepID=N4WQW1_9BACI|nr:hypothetical protein J416_08624 [Gracilibacillus halophilus YIM-C55.5]